MPFSLAHTGLTLAVGAGGWYAASRLRVPAAPMLGPMILVGAAACVGLAPVSFPSWVKLALQIVIGASVGIRLDRKTAAGLRSLLRPVAQSTLWMISSALLIGGVLACTGHADLVTALLGTAPGGIAEMSAMAVSLEANVALVATLQALRIFATMLVVPLYVRRQAAKQALPARPAPQPVAQPALSTSRQLPWIACLGAGAAGGVLFSWLGIPVPGVVGGMLAVAGLQVAGLAFQEPPAWLRTVAQVGLGILVGTTLNRETVAQLGSQFLPIMLTTAATVANGLILARFVQGWLHSDAQTALLACAPAGVTQMAVIAEELGAQVFVVSLFQLARLLAAILVLPMGFRLLLLH